MHMLLYCTPTMYCVRYVLCCVHGMPVVKVARICTNKNGLPRLAGSSRKWSIVWERKPSAVDHWNILYNPILCTYTVGPSYRTYSYRAKMIKKFVHRRDRRRVLKAGHAPCKFQFPSSVPSHKSSQQQNVVLWHSVHGIFQDGINGPQRICTVGLQSQ